ncbi:TerD family protein [Streptomyces sp. G1]|nr:TerD family protein [Streptomyces sp. G1]
MHDRDHQGGNLPLSGESMRVAVVRRDDGPGSPAVDAAALLVGADGKVRGRGDLVFYNQPEHAASAVRLLGDARGEGGVTADWLEIDPGRVEPCVERIVVAASCDGGTFGEVENLYLRAVGAATGEQLALYAVEGATTETAILLGEFYRRDGGWKFRAVGQGYASGLPGLATDSASRCRTRSSPPRRRSPTGSRPRRRCRSRSRRTRRRRGGSTRSPSSSGRSSRRSAGPAWAPASWRSTSRSRAASWWSTWSRREPGT